MTAISLSRWDTPPMMQITITDLPAGTASLRVERVLDDLTERVRGDSTTPIIGTTAAITDWAMPIVADGRNITYQVTPYGAGGQPLQAPTTRQQWLPAAGHDVTWLADPDDPVGAVRVTHLSSSDDDDETATATIDLLHTVTGLPVPQPRGRWRRSRAWLIEATDETTIQAVDQILGCGTAHAPTSPGAGLLQIRGRADCLNHPTGVLYVACPEVQRRRPIPHEPRVRWSWEGVETRPPAAPAPVGRFSYQDDLDRHPTYQASLSAHPRYSQRVNGW